MRHAFPATSSSAGQSQAARSSPAAQRYQAAEQAHRIAAGPQHLEAAARRIDDDLAIARDEVHPLALDAEPSEPEQALRKLGRDHTQRVARIKLERRDERDTEPAQAEHTRL